MKDVGIEVDINCTANRREFLADMNSWDVYASALVTAPSGDPQYFFTTSCLPGMSYNFGAYDNPQVNALIEQLTTEFDTAKRSELAIRLQQAILDDNAYVLFFLADEYDLQEQCEQLYRPRLRLLSGHCRLGHQSGTFVK